MKKTILSSHGFKKNITLRKKIFELLPVKSKKLSVVIITTASDEWKEKNKNAVIAKQEFENMGFKEVDFLDVEFENPDILKNYDVIFINGGNPFYLLFHLKKSGADKIIKELIEKEVVVIGVSGGGLVLGPNIDIVNYFDKKSNIVNLRDLSGLSVTDVIIYPHYTEDVEDKIKEFEAEFNCKVKRLDDRQSIVV